MWETTQGSVISGETIKQGAIRELVEETGILIDENNLIPVFKYVHEDNPSIYIGFLTIANKVSAEMKVIINELEIMEYRFIDYNELIKFIQDNPSVLKRPIMIDERRFQVGYNAEEIRVFIPRELRKLAECSRQEACPQFINQSYKIKEAYLKEK